MRSRSLRILAPLLASTAMAAPVKVFILSGQSNMNGMGSMADLVKNKYSVPSNVQLFRDQDGCPDVGVGCLPDDHSWRPLRIDEKITFGQEMGIADVLSKTVPITENIYLLKVSWGGTALRSDPNLTNYWEFTNGLEGWSSSGTSTPAVWNKSGTVSAQITGNDPFLLSPPMKIDASKEKIIHVKMSIRSSLTEGRIYFCHENGDWSEINAKSFEVVANNSFPKEYVIDMSTVPSWNGTITQFRIDPPAGNSGSSYSIDYVRLGMAVEVKKWDFDPASGLNGWVANSHISGFVPWSLDPQNPSNLSIAGRIAGEDPWVLSPDELGVNIDSARTLKIRLYNNTSATEAQVYFSTNESPNLSEERSVVFSILPAKEGVGVQEYLVDMSRNTFWKGTLRRLRIDPVRSAVQGTFAIDDIRLMGWTQPTWLNTGSDLYPWFLRNVRKALKDLENRGVSYELKGMFWMQGESDGFSAGTSSIYEQSLQKFVAKVRSDLNAPSLPFIYGMIRNEPLNPEQFVVMSKAYGDTNSVEKIAANYRGRMWPFGKAIQSAQFRAQTTIPNSACMETSAWHGTKSSGCYWIYGVPNVGNCDPAHFGTDALLQIGWGFGEAYKDGVSTSGCANPDDGFYDP
ncbi:MAG TPA: sialate O-acetylesterase [Fibrobacteria bacterium]|nr:sialate O-acetylesterase [Fibrobacteria bacterium]